MQIASCIKHGRCTGGRFSTLLLRVSKQKHCYTACCWCGGKAGVNNKCLPYVYYVDNAAERPFLPATSAGLAGLL